MLFLGYLSIAIVATPADATGARHTARRTTHRTSHTRHARRVRTKRSHDAPARPRKGVQSHRTAAPAGARPVATPVLQPQPVSRAASIATVLATTCQNTEIVPDAANLEAVRASVLCLINRVRAEHGETPLATNAKLERAAAEHSEELVADNYFAHIAPNGTTPVDRIRATGYIPGPSFGYVIGENLAWGTLSLSTPQSIVAAWVASPGHLANILESQYEDTGIGIVPAVPPSLGGGEQGATYAQEFGVIIS
jgi:uncharacterized protein YkwD